MRSRWLWVLASIAATGCGRFGFDGLPGDAGGAMARSPMPRAATAPRVSTAT